MTISEMTSGGHYKARLKSLETRSCQLTARHVVARNAELIAARVRLRLVVRLRATSNKESTSDPKFLSEQRVAH